MNHLDEILAATEAAPLRSLDVPEWGKTIYWRPLSLAKREEIQRRGSKSSARVCAAGLMLAALDQHGQRMFPDDVQTLAAIEGKFEGAVVARVAARIFGDAEPEQVGEDSAPTPISASVSSSPSSSE